MATVLNSNNINLISQTPALGKVYPNGTQPQIKGAFIYNNSQPTQVYPPILPVELTQYNVYTDISVTVSSYDIIAITVSYSVENWGYNDNGHYVNYVRVEWSSNRQLPFNLTLYYVIEIYGIEFIGNYEDWFQDTVNGTVIANRYSTGGTIWLSYNDYNEDDYNITDVFDVNVGIGGYNRPSYINGNYYIYIVGEATAPSPDATVTGSVSYVYFTAYMNKLPKYISYTGNIASQQNLFNFTYDRSISYMTDYMSYTLTQYPSFSYYCYFTINGTSNGNNEIPVTNASGYANNAITQNLYMKNLPFRCPTIGYTYISTSYYVDRSDFGYYFCGYFSTNPNVVPWDGDPMIDSTYTLFDYNSSNKVTRYKVHFPYLKNGWMTERIINDKYKMMLYNWDPWGGYPSISEYAGSGTRAINNGGRFIYLSTSSSLTFRVTSEGNYADITTGTYYINSSTGTTLTESFGWTSGGATPNYNHSRYLLHGTDGATHLSYPSWNLWASGSPDFSDTSRTYSVYINPGDGTEERANTFINYIYSSLTVTLHVEDRAFYNNFTLSDSGSKALIDLEYTYRHTPQTVYIYEIGHSSAAVKQVTFVAKRIGSFTLYWNGAEFRYVVRDFKKN